MCQEGAYYTTLFFFAAGVKPANANLQSTVFSAPKSNALKGRRHFVESTEIDLALSSVAHPPIAEGESMNAGEAVGKSPSFSRTYLSVAFNPPPEGVESPVYAVDGEILNCNKKVVGSNKSMVFKEFEKDDQSVALSLSQSALPRFMRDAGREARAKSSLHLRRSTVFDDDDPSQQQRLWSSGFTMSSCRSRTAVENDTYRSHVLTREQSEPNLERSECGNNFQTEESINLE